MNTCFFSASPRITGPLCQNPPKGHGKGQMMLADIASGEVDTADVLFLIAFILFVIATVMAAMAKAVDSVIVRAGFACVALAWLLL